MEPTATGRRRLSGVAGHLALRATLRRPTVRESSPPAEAINCGLGGFDPATPAASRLTPAEIASFNEDGFILIRGAASPDQTARARRAMYHQLGMTPTDPDGWYETPPHATAGPFQHITFFGTPHERAAAAPHCDDEAAAWEIAQNQRVHSAFAALWGTDQLWANVEMGSFKPPWRPNLPKYGAICHAGVVQWFSLGDALPMHWDFAVQDLANVASPPLVSWGRDLPAESRGTGSGWPAGFGLQANLFLNDRSINGGASCVNAGYIQHHAEWVKSTDGKRELERMAGVGKQHPKMFNVPGHRLNVFAKAGDLLIWHRMTPHGSSRNTAEDCRLALFLTLYPASDSESERRTHAIKWRTQWGAFGGGVMENVLEKNALGRRLAGLDAWPTAGAAAAAGSGAGDGGV
jgi:hypothetical protein